MKNWFEVSKEGLRSLMAGKPKWFIVRELVQNAWDELITKCEVIATYNKPIATIMVTDDSPDGFRDIADAYTIFKKTKKRKDPTKRGRFNFGEKQVLALCNRGKVTTTTGTIIFDKKGRHASREKTEKGSLVEIEVRMSKVEFDEVLNSISKYHVPEDIQFSVNGNTIPYRNPLKSFQAKLRTCIQEGDSFRPTERITTVNLYKEEQSFLYELGIPVMEIDCTFSVDIQQKIPLSADRDSVPFSFLQDVYAEVLNHTSDIIDSEESSDTWVHEAMADSRIWAKAVKTVINNRYGNKVCVATPGDSRSIDEAISHGYNVVHGTEMGKDEWDNVRKAEAMTSTARLFPSGIVDSTDIEPNGKQKRIAKYATRIAKAILGIDISVRFVSAPGATVLAMYGVRTLTFCVNRLPNNFFDDPIAPETTELILHELAHEKGSHTEAGYIDCLAKMGGQLVNLAIRQPSFFNIE